MTAASTLFGVSRVLERVDAEGLCNYLETLFEDQYDRKIASQDADLKAMGSIFGAGVQPRAVRSFAANLRPPSTSRPTGLPETLAIRIDHEKCLLTPEGRVAIGVIRNCISDGSQVVIPEGEILRALSDVGQFYGSSHREWITSRVAGGDLRPKSFAVLLLLLINGSVGEANAFRTPDDPSEQARLASAVTEVANSFLKALDADLVSEGEALRIKSNWMYTQAAAEMPGLVSSRAGAIWIEPERIDALVERIAALLAKRRHSYSEGTFSNALSALVETYEKRRSVFTTIGVGHERPHVTARRVDEINEAYGRALRASSLL